MVRVSSYAQKPGVFGAMPGACVVPIRSAIRLSHPPWIQEDPRRLEHQVVGGNVKQCPKAAGAGKPLDYGP